MHKPDSVDKKQSPPRLIAWETTKQCKYQCRHCRASAADRDFTGELSTREAILLLDNVAAFAKPIIILTGGEPMAREDIYELAAYGTSLGLKMVMAPCGPLVNEETVRKILDAGITRISLSIDGADQATHDNFRQVEGAFQSVILAARLARAAGLEFQINTTVSKYNYQQLDEILGLALELGAVSFHPFLLVPVGRGKTLTTLEIEPREYEEVLTWIYQKSLTAGIGIKPTCAPHYYRIFRQREAHAGRKVTPETHGMNAMTKGCLGGQGFAFISNTGKLRTCGFLELEAGDLRAAAFNFKTLWEESALFVKLREKMHYTGKCGVCEYWRVCGGCRARAFAATGDPLSPEPYCTYQPHAHGINL